MSHRLLPAALAAIALLLAPGAATAKRVPSGPAGAAFYTTPKPLGGKRHGDLLRARRLTGAAALPGARRTDLLLYRGTGVDGKPVAISGALSIPKGKAPRGGWPVISYAHGTTGLADQCAPTRDGSSPLTAYVYPTLTSWLKRGWAVVRTDYEGLGTAGVHPYLVGTSEGRAVLDVVRAARQRDRRLSTRRVILAGHSQGGHAALWAAALAPSYTRDLRVKGTVAFAPASHTGKQGALISALKDPSGLTGLAASILAGVEVQRPALDVAGKLTDRARALYPQVATRCLPDLLGTSSFGGLAPADLLRPDADLAPVLKALNENDPETLKIKTPLRVEQGLMDTTVFPSFTKDLVTALRGRKATIDFVERDGVDHGAIVIDGAKASTSWIAKRLR
ncbi:MAG: alpha/beta fold hydrolase [Solirubrobacterales bacterium]|nr:alpha/beta fold hydrolase [Solirubrobacterales bacterium]